MRISYVGGGSDYKEFYKNYTGNVVGVTINQYVYVFLNQLSDIAPENFRFTYRKTESVQHAIELDHPVLRETLQMLDVKRKLNIGTFSELPSGVGLGGSSAFTVALIKVLKACSGEYPNQYELARMAILIEREILKESGGVQDQYHAAFGGFRHYSFQESQVVVSEPLLTAESMEYISARQLLVWVGEPRLSSDFAAVTESNLSKKLEFVKLTSELAASTAGLLSTTSVPQQNFSDLVDSVKVGWELKQEYAQESHELVGEIISKAFLAGGKAFKLCGAGGTGFVLVLAEIADIPGIISALHGFSVIHPQMTKVGTTILHEEW
jgi:D-glycero-alpha-D-manno-heptose-7-phosphate kinase